jgi:hypothetical protein
VNSAELIRWLAVRPFQPFRICFSDGTSIEVLHAEDAIPLRGTALVARRRAPEVAREPYTTISLLHVVRIEPIPSDN